MKRILVLLLCLVAFSAGPAQAALLWIDWVGSVQAIHFTLPGHSGTANIASALGWLRSAPSATPAPLDPGAEHLGYVYCVDIFNFAADNAEFGVEVRTDGTGWTTPVGDGDDMRVANGWRKAGWVAQIIGGSINHSAADAHDRRLALNVLIWEQIYGPNFVLKPLGSNGLTAAQFGYLGEYRTIWQNSGYAEVASTRWFDNDTAGNYHQDFITNGVPEPTTLMLLGGGLLGWFGVGARRRGK